MDVISPQIKGRTFAAVIVYRQRSSTLNRTVVVHNLCEAHYDYFRLQIGDRSPRGRVRGACDSLRLPFKRPAYVT